MTAALVRLPDQFRPARSAPTAATPTCCSCCCCCCCAATLISASVVLPMQVEILARRGMVVADRRAGVPPRRPPDDLPRRKLIGASAPLLTLISSIIVGVYVDPTLGTLMLPAVLVWLCYTAFSAFPRAGSRATANAAVIIAAFTVEFSLAFVLIIWTFVFGYLVLVVAVPIVVISFFRRRRDALPPVDAVRPPPFDWPEEGSGA